MQWVTRERPKIDRIACPWLIIRFIDPVAEFLYVPAGRVLTVAAETSAIPCNVPNVEYGHVGEFCSFDAFLRKHNLTEPALHKLAAIVRGGRSRRPRQLLLALFYLVHPCTRACRGTRTSLCVADTGRPGLTPQSAGLLAISQGLSKHFSDDHDMLRHGLVMYDALYSWCRHA